MGRVGSGLKRQERDAAKKAIDRGFQFPIEVHYNGLSAKGLMRHPTFKGFRTDIKPDDTDALGAKQFLDVPKVT